MNFNPKNISSIQQFFKLRFLSIVISGIALITLGSSFYYIFASQLKGNMFGQNEKVSETRDVQGIEVESGQTLGITPDTPTPTSTPKFVTTKPKTTSKPSMLPLATVQPTPFQHNTTTVNNTPISTNSQTDTSTNDAYIEYLKQQEAEIQKKREYCEQLYASVTASLQPLYAERDTISQKYSEAINSGNTEKIAYYQQESSRVQSQINTAYNEHYYSVCP
jgi:hypothetical protein